MYNLGNSDNSSSDDEYDEELDEDTRKSIDDLLHAWKSYRDEWKYTTGSFISYRQFYKIIDILEEKHHVPDNERFKKIYYDTDFNYTFEPYEVYKERYKDDYTKGYEEIHDMDMTLYHFNEKVFETRMKICDYIHNLVKKYHDDELSENTNWGEIKHFLKAHGCEELCS